MPTGEDPARPAPAHRRRDRGGRGRRDGRRRCSRRSPSAHPDTREQLFSADGELNRYVNVYLNDEDVRVLDGLETAVADTDTVVILPAMAGGCSALRPGSAAGVPPTRRGQQLVATGESHVARPRSGGLPRAGARGCGGAPRPLAGVVPEALELGGVHIAGALRQTTQPWVQGSTPRIEADRRRTHGPSARGSTTPTRRR